MGFNCGIVGLPNVGKSTLFNALTQTANAQAENFPFCTIEPNVGIVAVPDKRLHILGNLAKTKREIPTQLEFVDIAGLVKGASKGEGLGNQFLGNIRQTDAIIYVVRCFENTDVTHVEGSIDPIRDCETIETELILADLESLEKRIPTLEKKAKGNDKHAIEQISIINKVLPVLSEGKSARHTKLEKDEIKGFKQLQLLTSKPVLYVCNVDEDSAATGNEFSEKVFERAKKEHTDAVVICASIEQEIAVLEDAEEKAEFLESLGLEESGLDKIIKAGYHLLDLITYFTAGVKETRAWTVTKGSTAPQAAGVIHTDFEKGFIRAETISYDDYVSCGGEQKAKETGKARQEGKNYIVKDGDVMHFKFSS